MQKASILTIAVISLLVFVQPISAGLETCVNSSPPFSADSSGEVLKEIAANMVHIDGGTFLMGSNDGKGYEKPVHTVSLRSFSISKYAVTQSQWKAVMGDSPADHKACPDCPVEEVNYEEASAFIYKLNALTGLDYHLPTEAQFEYAARGGSKSKGYEYSGGSDPEAVAWYAANSGMQSHTVGLKQPNELGLYDMSGNVWEWCSDWFDIDYYGNSPSENPPGASGGIYRILRGGSWLSDKTNCRVSFRFATTPVYCSGRVGFRLAKD